jgi:RHS repeat-associated protein
MSYEFTSTEEFYVGTELLKITTTDPRGFSSFGFEDHFGATVKTINAKGYRVVFYLGKNHNFRATWVENVMPDGYEVDPSDPNYPEPNWIVRASVWDILNYEELLTFQVSGDEGTPHLPIDSEIETWAVADNFVTIRTEYDKKENPTIARQPLGNWDETRYNEMDLVSRTIRVPYIATLREETTYRYDKNGNVIAVYDDDSETDPENKPIRHAHDGFDRRIATIDEAGTITETVYDDADRVIQTRTGTGWFSLEGEEVVSYTISVVYAETGNIFDELGRHVRTDINFFKVEYDITTHLNSITGQPCGAGDDHWVTTVNLFNEDSQLINTWNDRENKTTFTFDSAGRRDSTTDALGNSIQRTFDKNSNVIYVLEVEAGDPNSPYHMCNFYDEVSQLVTLVSNMGNTRRFYHDSRGNVRYSTDASGAPSGQMASSLNVFNEPEYDFEGWQWNPEINVDGNKIAHGCDLLDRNIWTRRHLSSATITTRMTWDKNSRLKHQIDDNGNITTYHHDAKNRRWKTEYDDGTVVTLIYDKVDNVYQRIDANGTVITNTSDALGRLTHREIQPGPGIVDRDPVPNMEYQTTFENLDYDPLSRNIFAQNDFSTGERAYDSVSNLICEKQQHNGGQQLTVSSICDGLGNRLSLTYPNDRVICFVPDALNRTEEVKEGTTALASYAYVGAAHRFTQKALANSVNLEVGFDLEQRPISWEHKLGIQVVRGFTYQFDRENNKWDEQKVHGDGSADVYNHDRAYRVTNVKYGTSSNQIGNWNNKHTIPFDSLTGESRFVDYTLDGVGNREEVNDNGYLVPYWLDPNPPLLDYQVNQYTTVGAVPQDHDSNGNLTSNGEFIFFYNYANQLVEVRNAITLEQIAVYWHDVFGRRIQTLVEGLPYNFYYDEAQMIEKRGGVGAWSVQYVYGIGIDEPIEALRSDGTRYYYHANSLGSIVALTAENGDLVESVTYDIYGDPSVTQHNGYAATGNSYLFTGRRLDSETGLYWYRARHYNPATGRFLQRDPVGFVDKLLNLYTYLGNRPTGSTDPFGKGAVLSIVKAIFGKFGFWVQILKIPACAACFGRSVKMEIACCFDESYPSVKDCICDMFDRDYLWWAACNVCFSPVTWLVEAKKLTSCD